MASELTVTTALTFSKGGEYQDLSFPSNSEVINVSGKYAMTGVQTVAISPTNTVLDIGSDILKTTLGWIIIKNLDATGSVLMGSVDVGADNTKALIKIDSGETCVFRFSIAMATAPNMTALTTACEIQYILVSA